MAKVDSPAVGGDILTNDAEAGTESIGGVGPEPAHLRQYLQHRLYGAASSSRHRSSVGIASKTADPAWATIGTEVTYTVISTIPASLDLYNVTVVDVLPDSLDFDSYVSATCICRLSRRPGPDVQEYNPVVSPTQTTIAWDLGNIAPGRGCARSSSSTRPTCATPTRQRRSGGRWR